MFGDGHASCLKWANEVQTSSGPGPTNCDASGCVCESPSTTIPSNAVIPYGEQPRQQLSLDYILQGDKSPESLVPCAARSPCVDLKRTHPCFSRVPTAENYEGGLWRHSGDGTWAQGFIGPDGPNHAANPFEPVVNCPERGGSPGNGMQWLNSQAWLGAIQSAMWDFTIFTGPEGDTAVAATIAEQFQELRPGFFRPFGDGGGHRPMVSVVEQLPGNGCFDQRSPPPPPDPEGWRNPYWPGGRMRGKLYVEPPVGGHMCAHLVVVNLQLDAATVFAATIRGGSLTPSSFINLTATRMFVTGPTLSFSNGGTVTDWIGPGATNVYRVGNCTPPAVAGNLASPPVSTSYTGG